MENRTHKTYEQQSIVIDPSLIPGTPEHRKVYQAAYRKRNSNRLKDYDRNRFEGHRKRAHQLQPYTLTPEEYEIKLEEQKHSCAICGIHQSKLRVALCVDHNHENGENRGLLCDSCNRGIGLLKDSAEILDKAASYLRRYTKQA